MRHKKPTLYSEFEEKLNVYSHGAGFLLSLIALILLITRAVQLQNLWHILSFPVFGISLIVLYLASTLYHSSKTEHIRKRLQVFDHAAIYVLIAGTYTPFALVTLEGTTGWTIFAIIWSMAFIGIVLKLFFTGRFEVISTLMYVAMGWLIVFNFNVLSENLYRTGLIWLVAGGIAYSVGAIFYSINRIKLNHAIFHFFVLAGSFCHFVTVYFYVTPKA